MKLGPPRPDLCPWHQRVESARGDQALETASVYRPRSEARAKIKERGKPAGTACIDHCGNARRPHSLDRRQAVTHCIFDRRKAVVALVDVRRKQLETHRP